MVWDHIWVEICQYLDLIGNEIFRRSAGDWFFFFFPILLLCEIPRYYLPLLLLPLAQRLGLGRDDPQAMTAYLRHPPKVSVVLAGRNEEETIAAAITSLLQQDYPDYEIIIVDDHSEDGMHLIARRFARQGNIRLVRNCADRGRSGRPPATNLGVRLARGEIIISVDADCSFDRNMIRHMVGPFCDPKVGLVAGNLVVRNRRKNLLTRVQTIEYAVAIDLRKRWNDIWGNTLQASGALGAFRRSAVMALWGWDAELAEDGDISLRLLKAGWKTRFAPAAVAMTNVPETLRVLTNQRNRWDRGTLRTYFMKHFRLLRPSVASLPVALEMWGQLLFFCMASLIYPIFILWLWSHGLALFLVVMTISMVAYCALSLFTLLPISWVSHRLERPQELIGAALVTPIVKGILRWVRIRALVMELLRLCYKDSFLPDSAWNNAPRY